MPHKSNKQPSASPLKNDHPCAVAFIPCVSSPACGVGAFGYFEVTHDITKYCKAKVFSHVGKRTPIAVRFSTVGKVTCMYSISC